MRLTELLKRGVPRLDRAVYRATGGRTSLSGLLSGLPVVLRGRPVVAYEAEGAQRERLWVKGLLVPS